LVADVSAAAPIPTPGSLSGRVDVHRARDAGDIDIQAVRGVASDLARAVRRAVHQLDVLDVLPGGDLVGGYRCA
jgi:hypothetical protein